MGLKFKIEPQIVRFNQSGFNNETIFLEYFDRVIMPYCLKAHKNGKKVVFLLDDASFHRSKKLLERCDENAITVIVIPGGTKDARVFFYKKKTHAERSIKVELSLLTLYFAWKSQRRNYIF